jgi:glycosyltransferase involved in cell wall biosynthesis
VALEALAVGKPLLATNVDGLGEFLTEFSATQDADGRRQNRKIMLVSPHVSELAAGLKTLAEFTSNDWRCDQALPEKFTWRYLAGRYEEVLVGESPS